MVFVCCVRIYFIVAKRPHGWLSSFLTKSIIGSPSTGNSQSQEVDGVPVGDIVTPSLLRTGLSLDNWTPREGENANKHLHEWHDGEFVHGVYAHV